MRFVKSSACAYNVGKIHIPAIEESLIEMLGDNLANIPSDEQKFIEKVLQTLDASKFIANDYDL